MKKITTLSELAKICNCSTATVSYVLNGREDQRISEETKQKMSRSHTDPNSKSQKYYQSLRDGISKRKHFEGKIVHKGGVYKGVSLEELDTYLSKGWQIGARPKSEDWKRKARERNQKKI